jgi:uncharacterized protein involved in response to NO
MLFRQGFRPFFLAAGTWAALAVPLWVALFDGALAAAAGFDAFFWHAHEMLFGFVAAAIAGFLLTAIPNWTGRMPLQGLPLMALFGLWLLGRAAMLASGFVVPGLAALADLSFLAALLAVVLREILAGRNWRNLPVVSALAALLAANALMHAEALDLLPLDGAGWRVGIAVVTMLIGLIGGRIVPSFTRNWLAKRGNGPLPAPFGMLDKMAMALTGLALAVWIGWPEHSVAGALQLAAGVAQGFRLSRWQGHRTAAEPLVWSLHAGFAWVPVGLSLTGAGILWPDTVPPAAGLHALTAGAFASMILAVMTRATLGHTGNALAADRATTAIYALVAVAAAVRVAAAFLPEQMGPLLWLSAAAWVGAFGLFALRYGRLLAGR